MYTIYKWCKKYTFKKNNVGANANLHTAGQSQKAVTAYLSSKQLLPFGFADQYTCVYSVMLY